MYEPAPPPDGEERIVWLRGGPADWPFLRECQQDFRRRAGAPFKRTDGAVWPRLVAYSELSSAAPSKGGFTRRFWMANPDDFTCRSYTSAEGLVCNCPTEAVLPETIKAGGQSVAALEELRARPRRVPTATPSRRTGARNA